MSSSVTGPQVLSDFLCIQTSAEMLVCSVMGVIVLGVKNRHQNSLWEGKILLDPCLVQCYDECIQ